MIALSMISSHSEPVRLSALYTDTDGIDCSQGIDALRDHRINVRVLNTRDIEEILLHAKQTHALIVGYASVTRSMIEQLPELRIISLLSRGFDNVDLQAAREHGIWVTNITDSSTEEVATHALALCLHITRGLGVYAQNAKQGRWNDRDSVALPRLSTKTLGIIGYGRIGKRFAQMALPLFGEIIVHDPAVEKSQRRNSFINETSIRFTSLHEVKSNSDVISIHVPLSAATKEFVNEDFLSHMREGSYLINVSRGTLVNEPALLAAINSGKLAGAALDVLVTEPAGIDNPILQHTRILVTPHVAYLSESSEPDYVMMQANNVISYFENGEPITPLFTPEQPKPLLRPPRRSIGGN
jgi:phosphoglycerate dehydrogenase-like enzyme